MITSIRIDRDVPMKTRDGITLSADVYRPDDGKKYPAILSRTPYNKVWSGNNDFLTPTDAAFAGYAFVLQDTWGMNNNDEVLEYLPSGTFPTLTSTACARGTVHLLRTLGAWPIPH